MPERIFRGRLRVIDGDTYTPELADQSSLRFQHKAKFYQDGIDAIINQSDLKVGFQKSEVLALDGYVCHVQQRQTAIETTAAIFLSLSFSFFRLSAVPMTKPI